MANTLLTPDMITRKALQILHQKLNFIGTINRAYDESFAVSGAKIGDTLRIRLPNEYVIRSGATLVAQDTIEQSISLPVTSQKGVDTTFTSTDLTLKLDDFSERILRPAMSTLAANIEADALSMAKDVYNVVDTASLTTAMTFKKVMQARKALNDSLAPMDDNRTILLNTQDNVDVVDANKGLFHDSVAIKQQYREGMMGRTGGFDFYENTLWTKQSRGAGSGYLLNGVPANGATGIIVDTGTGAINKGETLTIANVFRVHPETKVSTGVLQRFVVTADYAGGAGTISISPAIFSTADGRQNVNSVPADNAAVTLLGTASKTLDVSMAYHKNAFTFATADLVLPDGTDMASRQQFDGISMRMIRDYVITSDTFPCRFDVLYGFKAIRPQMACRILNNEV